jgi:hypothetical protein
MEPWPRLKVGIRGRRSRPKWVTGGCRRQVDGTAGLPSAPEMPCAPRQLRLVPIADVHWALLQPARSIQSGGSPEAKSIRQVSLAGVECGIYEKREAREWRSQTLLSGRKCRSSLAVGARRLIEPQFRRHPMTSRPIRIVCNDFRSRTAMPHYPKYTTTVIGAYSVPRWFIDGLPLSRRSSRAPAGSII